MPASGDETAISVIAKRLELAPKGLSQAARLKIPDARAITDVFLDQVLMLLLSLDEKSQIQALDRTQLGLPLKRGRGQTRTHDYKRNGTTTLFAALNAANGEVFGLCQERHRHQEWLKFLRLIDQTP